MLRERAENSLEEDPFTLAAAEGDAAELKQESAASLQPKTEAALQIELLKVQLQMQKEQHERSEMKDKDLEMKRLEAASAEQLKRQELDIKRLEIPEQSKREQQPIILLKRFAEALKEVMHPQPTDPCALPSYFDNLEKVYKQFQRKRQFQGFGVFASVSPDSLQNLVTGGATAGNVSE